MQYFQQVYDKLGPLAPFILTAIFAAFALLAKRWWTKEGRREQISQFSDLAQIATLLQSGALTVQDVVEVEKLLLDRNKTALSNEPRGKDFHTQAEMNEFASREMRKMDLELGKVLIDLEAICDDAEVSALQDAQAKWLEFRESHAAFVSSIFEGGSMRPLMYFSCIETATKDRIEELRDYHEIRSS